MQGLLHGSTDKAVCCRLPAEETENGGTASNVQRVRKTHQLLTEMHAIFRNMVLLEKLRDGLLNGAEQTRFIKACPAPYNAIGAQHDASEFIIRLIQELSEGLTGLNIFSDAS